MQTHLARYNGFNLRADTFRCVKKRCGPEETKDGFEKKKNEEKKLGKGSVAAVVKSYTMSRDTLL